MDTMESIRATFFQECEEALAELETGLMAVEAGDADPETVNAVFRAVHSIKGGAGAFGLEQLVRFSHVFESTLDKVRAGRLAPEPATVKVLLRATDSLGDVVRAAQTGGVADEARCAAVAVELERLDVAAKPPPPMGPVAEPFIDDGKAGWVFGPIDAASLDDDLGDFAFTPVAAPAFDPPEPPEPGEDAGWEVRFRPHRELYAHANEAGLLLRELARLGPTRVRLDDAALPAFADLDPEDAYLAWTVRIEGAAGEADVREVFDFVEGDCDLTVARRDAVAPLPRPAELDALRPASAPPAPGMHAAPPSADEDPPAPLEGALQPSSPPAAAAPATIRVDLERVDRMIDLMGELVINQAVLAQRVTEAGLVSSRTGESALSQSLAELEQLTREIQDSVMAIRAQPVKSVFQRMPRLAREVAAQTGKQVRVVTEGEATEVDKTVIERLADPLTHMLRNAIDHGVESPQARLAAGKAAEGVVKLAAFHRSGRIVIEVSDDGAGIDRARVRAIAVEKGLVAADAAMSDEELDNLIFMPGFSTASAVSDISGRGVGMDVVKRSVAALGGRIAIASRPGEGSTFTLSLPLTLAVLDGMVVTIGGQTLVAPLTAIVETLRPRPHDVHPLGEGARVIANRGGYVPLIDVGAELGFREGAADPAEGVALLIEGDDGARAALMVDAIQGQRQVVIKSLEANYRQVRGIAAATILGDGRVALILDIDALVANARRPDATPRLAA